MRKSVIYTGLAVLLLTGYVMLIKPVEEKRALLTASIETGYANLEKYRRFVNGAEVSKEELARAKKELEAAERGVITEPMEPLAFAELQLRLQEAARNSGLRMLTVRPVQSVKHGGYASLPIYMEAEGGIKELSNFLKAMDRAESYMKIEKLVISHKDVREQKDLRVKLQVSGLMKI